MSQVLFLRDGAGRLLTDMHGRPMQTLSKVSITSNNHNILYYSILLYYYYYYYYYYY